MNEIRNFNSLNSNTNKILVENVCEFIDALIPNRVIYNKWSLSDANLDHTHESTDSDCSEVNTPIKKRCVHEQKYCKSFAKNIS